MSLRILIVDDTRFLRMMLTDILTNSGYEVVGQAENGLIGIEKFKELRPDIVMMDISMPEMDGIQALKEIRKIDADAVVLICSAMSQRELISKAIEAGANNYVTKPFDSDSINTLIENVIPLIERNKMADSEETEDHEEAENRVETKDHEETTVSFGEEPVLSQLEIEQLSQLWSDEKWDNDSPSSSEPELELEIDSDRESESELDLGQKQNHLIEGKYYELDQPEELLLEDEPDKEKSTDQSADQFGSILRAFAEFRDEENAEDAFKDDGKEENEDEYMSLFEGVDTDLELGSGSELASLSEEAATLMQAEEEEVGDVGEDVMEEAAKESDEEPIEQWDEEAIEQLNEETGDVFMINNEMANVDREEERIENMVQTENIPSTSDFKKINVKNIVSSIMCNWTEVSENHEANHLVIFNEHDKTIQIDIVASNDQKQSIKLTLDSFSYLVSWLKEKGIPVDPQ